MSTTKNYLVSNLRYLMDRRQVNPTSLADLIGNSPPQATIFRILNGESLTPRDTTIQPLADFFGVTLNALRYEDLSTGQKFFPSNPERKSAAHLNTPIVFVLTLAQTGMPIRLWDDEGNLMLEREGQATIATEDAQAFLVSVVDDAMAPRYNVGEYALVEPGTEPELEDDVLVCLDSGQVLLRRLLSRRSGIKLGFYRSGATQIFTEGQVAWCYYVSNPVPARKIKPL